LRVSVYLTRIKPPSRSTSSHFKPNNSPVDNLHEQAEGNKALTQSLVDMQRRQLEASQVLGQESASAYEKFLDSAFFYYGRTSATLAAT
jgi:hypothetical protein